MRLSLWFVGILLEVMAIDIHIVIYTIKSTSRNPPGANDFGFLVNLGGFSWIKNDHRQEFVWICPIIFPKRFWASNEN